MKSSNQTMCSTLSLTALALLLPAQLVFAQTPALELAPLPEPQVLEQGPIHEAFAEPLALDAQPTEIIPREPPLPIEEFPPEIRPEGHNVLWIGGYFQWDPERNDFVWVSGFYRDVPPGRSWVPGEWNQVEGGWQWFPGFWTEGELQQDHFLPAPPATLEQGPSSPAPGDNFIWAPGTWRWMGNTYAWQAGYWYQARPDWVWVPSHYSCTPRGHVYVGGYWDYPVVRRGLLYAPVYWRTGHVGFAHHYYRPHRVLNTALLFANLFIDRGHHHYYYGFHNRRPGWIHPWGHNHGRHGHAGRRGYYDPIFAHHHWHRGHGGKGNRGRLDHRNAGRDLVVGARDLHRKGNHDMKLRKLNQNELVAERRKAAERKVAAYKPNRRNGDRGRSLAGEVGQIGRRERGSATTDGQLAGRKRSGERTRNGDRDLADANRRRGDGNRAGPGRARNADTGATESTVRNRGAGERAEESLRRRTTEAGKRNAGEARAFTRREGNRTTDSQQARQELGSRNEMRRFQAQQSADQDSSRARNLSRARERQLGQQQSESKRTLSSRAGQNTAQQWQQRREAARNRMKTSQGNTQQSVMQRRQSAGNISSGNQSRSRNIVRGQSPQPSTSARSSQSKSRIRSFSQNSNAQVMSRKRSSQSSSAQASSGRNRSRSRSFSSGGGNSSKSFSRGSGGGGGGGKGKRGGKRGKR